MITKLIQFFCRHEMKLIDIIFYDLAGRYKKEKFKCKKCGHKESRTYSAL